MVALQHRVIFVLDQAINKWNGAHPNWKEAQNIGLLW